MFSTKESVGRSMALVGLALCAAALAGCADAGGLRSAWSDRPSLLGFRDRKPKPAPDPANDSYARSMHAARDPSGQPSRSPRDASADLIRERDGDGPPAPDDERLADSGEPDADESIRVTLGTPVPLPTASQRAPDPARSVRSRPAEERPAEIAAAPRPTTRPAPARPAPARPAPAQPKPQGEDARALVARSEAKLQSLGTYQVRMKRVERVGGKMQPEEEVVLSVHRKPREVRLTWDKGPSQGREVIYSTRVDDRSLFVHMPKTAIPLPTMKMAIDSPMVTKSSKHSIAEAGFDTILDSLRKSVAEGSAAYRGVEKPPGLDRPSHVFTRRDPGGESWTVFLDARSMLPSMVVAMDSAGDLDEKYIYHEVVEDPAELAAADAFDPDRRWGSSKGGLLSRFARGGPAPAGSGDGQTATR